MLSAPLAAETPSCVNQHMADSTASKVRSLRKRLDLTQDQVAARAAEQFPDFRRDYVTKVETGANKATTARIRRGLAAGLGLTQEELSRFLDGTSSLEEVLLHASPRDTVAEVRVEREDHHVPDDDETAAESALFRAMNPDRYTPRDFDAARAAMRAGPRDQILHADLDAVAVRFLDVARQIRREGEVATTTSILWRVAVGRHSRDAELAREVSAAEDAEADAELRAAGHEPGQGKARLDERVAGLKAKKRTQDA